jgi:hypothetical protein
VGRPGHDVRSGEPQSNANTKYEASVHKRPYV